MSHPAVKTGITHCGFGGTNDFIITGKPPILWPHFDDQYSNAKLLQSNGVGPILCNALKFPTSYESYLTYEKKVFDEKHLITVIKDALSNKKYKENIIKMKE